MCVTKVAAEAMQKRGVAVPSHFRLVSDNATSEVKNNGFFKFASLMVARGTVASMSMAQGRVGHTHGRQDSGFASIATYLVRSDVLEDPDDFAARINQGDRSIHVEKVDGAQDFTQWLSSLPTFHGHVPARGAAKRGEDACHCFKWVRRESLNDDLASQVDDSSFAGHEPHPRDTILLVKQYMASDELSQQPLLCLPWSEDLMARFAEKPVRITIPRSIFSKKQAQEFLRTAKVCEEEPWKLQKAAKYLRNLVTLLAKMF